MYDNNSKGISFTAGFFMLIAFLIAGFVMASGISLIIWQKMTGLKLEQMMDNLSNPALAWPFRILQIVTAVVGFFVPAVVTASLLNTKPFQLLGFNRGVTLRQAALAILLVGAALMVSTGLSFFNSHIPIPTDWKAFFDKLEEQYNQQVIAIVNLKTVADYIVALLIMAFLPAVCEETLFRGGMQNFLTRSTKMPWVSIIVVSLIFSAVHLSYYGFLSRFFLGVVLGALYYYSGKLWLSILAHFINNALALTVLFYYTQNGKPIQEAMKNDPTNYWGILALPLVVFLVIALKRASDRQRFA